MTDRKALLITIASLLSALSSMAIVAVTVLSWLDAHAEPHDEYKIVSCGSEG